MQRLESRAESLKDGGLISVRRRVRLSSQIKTALGVVVVLCARTHDVGVCYDSDRKQHRVEMSSEWNKRREEESVSAYSRPALGWTRSEWLARIHDRARMTRTGSHRHWKL